ncbi:hypothetical protein [Aurantiacibacter hainanensis]|uniref:hypothetical protein n=1 Tax=Aurantiacibacter hainanensis TaxID=3076114 RepID=UPI0030C6CA01
MNKSIFAAFLLVAGSSAAIAQDADQEREEATSVQAANSQTEDDAAAQEDEASQEVICRRERVTGSLTRVRRICLTRAEWDAVEADTRDGMISAGRNASGGQCVPVDMSGRC